VYDRYRSLVLVDTNEPSVSVKGGEFIHQLSDY
jgi:hypothetical protein